MSMDTFGSHKTLTVGSKTYRMAHLGALEQKGWNMARLPFATRILLENLLRREDGEAVTAADIEQLAQWDPKAPPSQEIAFMPGRVLLQDFTGVPAVVDLAAMRDAMQNIGGDPARINPLQPAELVIDHSVQVDAFGKPSALEENAEKEYERNSERYSFLRWGQSAFSNFQVVPPETGIVHQINLEYLARGVMESTNGDPTPWAFPDTLVGTDSHTTMINGLGVLGWGVGGIEAEAAMLGQPISMLVPQVVGFRLKGKLPEGSTATDLVLTVVEMLRKHGVVGKFVEFFGSGISELSLADRATIANMGPEYGATCGIFPMDQVTLDYLKFTGRDPEQVKLVEAYMKEQGLWHTPDAPEAEYTSVVELDLATVQPSLAGPKRPQDRILLKDMKPAFLEALPDMVKAAGTKQSATGDTITHVSTMLNGERFTLTHGSVVIAAITSCTNTSNPSVMVAAGLVAKKAAELGLETRGWVKTSLAPGSKVVTEYLKQAGLLEYLEKLRFHIVGYGCTTCIGNSGPLPREIHKAIEEGNLVVASVLSGNRNFEGRVHNLIRASYLASPPLVVAYALAGRVDLDFEQEPLGMGTNGPVFFRDIWPSQQEIQECVNKNLQSDMFGATYSEVFEGSSAWNSILAPEGQTYFWDPESTYVRHPPYFEGMPPTAPGASDITGARVLGLFGDSVTTDHISPAGAFGPDTPAGKYLTDRGVDPADFNSYGSRRGNHEIMMRGTFANVRIKNLLVPGVEGGFTVHHPDGEKMTIFDAAMQYAKEETPLIILAGKEYGTGSSRDWAAKGPRLLGIRAVIAQSYERIHRSNLVGMGILPLQFRDGEGAESLGLTGKEIYDFSGIPAVLEGGQAKGKEVQVTARAEDGKEISFQAVVRLDTPNEVKYFEHGGILHFVLRKLIAS